MKKNILKLFTLLVAMSVIFTACGGDEGGSVFTPEKLSTDSREMQLQQPQSGDTTAVIHTSEGDIKVLLFPDYAPKAVYNFTTLATQGYYNETAFHRVVSGFIAQAGSPDGTPGGGRSVWGLEFEDEFSDSLHHYNGALSMANHGRDTNSSQFFFVTTPIGKLDEDTAGAMTNAGWRNEIIETYKDVGGRPALDYRYTVFGQIYEGLDVAYKISRAETVEGSETPKEPITITSIEVITVE